jgi:FixJ family two-component response regulator
LEANVSPHKLKYGFEISSYGAFIGWAVPKASASHFGKPLLSTLTVISVIDDDASVRAATSNLLSSHGYPVYTFASAEEFVQSARLCDSSCVIADVQMSAMSGLDLLTHMRAEGYDVPFIFITAFHEEGVRARALEAGAICFLAKPFAGPTLINCLEGALDQHRDGAGQ